MNEFTRSLLYVALLVCVPIVTACIQKGIAVFIEFIVAKTNDIKVQRLVREIGSAVSNAVAANEPDLRQRPEDRRDVQGGRAEGSAYEGRVRRS